MLSPVLPKGRYSNVFLQNDSIWYIIQTEKNLNNASYIDETIHYPDAYIKQILWS